MIDIDRHKPYSGNVKPIGAYMKMQKGRIPSKDDGWEFDKTFESDDSLWSLYIKPQQDDSHWLTCKLVANGKAETKANYWFFYNMTENIIAPHRDLSLLQKQRFNLHQAVCWHLLNRI